MNRRDFLKVIGLGLAIPTSVLGATKSAKKVVNCPQCCNTDFIPKGYFKDYFGKFVVIAKPDLYNQGYRKVRFDSENFGTILLDTK